MSIVKVQGNASGTGTLTIAAPNTNTDRTLTLPDNTGTVVTTGSTAVVSQAMLASNVAGNGPAFSAYANGNQTLSNSTWTKIQYNLEEFDTNSNYDTSNYRFTPTVAGYYQISAACNFAPNSTNTRFLELRKNGSGFKLLQAVTPNSVNYMSVSGSCLLYLNGSTDYVEIFAMQNSGSSLATSASSSEIWFQAALVRAA